MNKKLVPMVPLLDEKERERSVKWSAGSCRRCGVPGASEGNELLQLGTLGHISFNGLDIAKSSVTKNGLFWIVVEKIGHVCTGVNGSRVASFDLTGLSCMGHPHVSQRNEPLRTVDYWLEKKRQCIFKCAADEASHPR